MPQRFYGASVGLFAMLSYFNILNNSFTFDDFGLLNEAVRRGDWWFLASVWMLVAFSLVANVVAPIGTMMGEALMKARIGEVVRVDLPRGEKRFEVVELL